MEPIRGASTFTPPSRNKTPSPPLLAVWDLASPRDPGMRKSFPTPSCSLLGWCQRTPSRKSGILPASSGNKAVPPPLGRLGRSNEELPHSTPELSSHQWVPSEDLELPPQPTVMRCSPLEANEAQIGSLEFQPLLAITGQQPLFLPEWRQGKPAVTLVSNKIQSRTT